MGSRMGHVGSKTRSLGKIRERYCVCSRDKIFNPIIMKLGRNDCLDEILDELENGSRRVKKKIGHKVKS